ncbi:MAG: hypothetical protein WKF37_16610, partial [Bryobacteraceae bacterium]
MTKQALFTCILVVSGMCAFAQTPTTQPTFLTATYYQVDSDKVELYDQHTSTTYRKIMQALVDTGNATSWTHYKIVIANGVGPAATHVSVIGWAKQASLDPSVSDLESVYKKAGTSRAAVLEKTRPIGRKTVRREVWRMYDRAGEAPSEGDFVRLDPKRLTSTQQYVELERKIWKPMHEQRIKAGSLKGWTGMVLALPGGEDYQYQAATAEIYKDEAQMFLPTGISDLLKLAHSDRDVSGDMKTMTEISKNLARSVLRAQYVIR